MEEFSQTQLGASINTTTARAGAGVYIYGGSSSSSSPTTIAPHPPAGSSSMYGGRQFNTNMHQQQHLPLSDPFQHLISETTTMPCSAKSEDGSSRNTQHRAQQQIHYPFGIIRSGGQDSGTAEYHHAEAIKAKIISHPQYSNLLQAYMDCQKVGAPPEVVARLTAITRDFEARQHQTVLGRDLSANDPELNQFMEAYYDMLVKYREELTRPLQEAMDFLRRVESQLSVLTNGSARVFSPDKKAEGLGSSDEDQEGSGGETELPEIDPRAEDKELKHHLLKKYSGYLSSLKQELSKKKKKGKLPKEARQKLLNWWELHYKWPYPSEMEKLALAESTGLDQKQINNWFINQRKRHWKPSDDMQFVVMDGYHPQNTSGFYMDGHHHFMGDGSYRLGP